MEPITHFLTGAVLGRAGLNRKTAFATLAGVLAAEAADLDVLWSFGGPVEGLKHHRGITHTFWAVPVVVAAVAGAIWGLDRWRRHRAVKRTSGSRPLQPVRWGWLSLTALLAALSHLFLDWTNTYGLRPFFPLNPRWYSGDLVFIAEPVLWALLLLAMLAPALGGLVGGEIGERKKPFRGQGWAIFALCAMAALWGWRWSEHARALSLLEQELLSSQPASRVTAMPYPLNPFRWHALVETAQAYQSAEVNTRTGRIESDPRQSLLYKPSVTPAVEAAKQSELGRVFLDWGRWAVVRDLGPVAIPAMAPPKLPAGREWTTVEFTDLRFAYGWNAKEGTARRAPMGGWVYIVDGREEAGMVLGGRVQKLTFRSEK